VLSNRFFNFTFVLSTVAVLGFGANVFAQGDITKETDYRKVKSPDAYGSILMERNTKANPNLRPVVFPHWAHRPKYTCNVCHPGLGFAMKAGETDIKQADLEAGKYCGKCHNGTESFALNECNRCHSYQLDIKENKKIATALKDLPPDFFGNKINWGAAVKEGKIKPKASLDGKKKLEVLDTDIVIPATKYSPHPPDVLFPHKAHTMQLECANCHPSIFKDKKGGNPEMNMMKIISGQYCGTCHGRVSFPIEDCFRCHSQPLPKKEEPKKEEKK